MNKPSVLIIYDYFYPGFRAGGPVQSLTNLMAALQNHYSFSVLTTAYDLMSDKPYDTVQQNSWNTICLPNMIEPVKVWYAGKSSLNYNTVKKIILELNPNILYLNGIYSYRLFIFPLLVSSFSSFAKIVVCPRGMLQSGALSVKSNKKKIYIKTLQVLQILNNVCWHATNDEEAEDIKKYFPINKGINVAFNIPKTPYKNISYPEKKVGELNLVYLSLITQKKNLLLLLNVIKQMKELVQLNIYGPVKDNQYWQECKTLIDEMPEKVKYFGDIQPIKVQETIERYHALCLFTKGENFGHALYESLSVGRPIVTSFFTPWNDLKSLHAGVNVNIYEFNDCTNKLSELAALNQEEYNNLYKGSHALSVLYFEKLNSVVAYQKVFN